MSLDFYLEGPEVEEECICDYCEHTHMKKYTPELFHDNITHNLASMAEAAGIYACLWRPDENNYEYAKQIIDILEKGIAELKKHPQKYIALNPVNGWGSYERLLIFTLEVLEACKEHPEAKINVSR
jgi:hypothetical protein